MIDTALFADLHYSPALVRQASLAYVRRGLGVSGWIAVACMIMGLAIMMILNPGSWWAGAALGAVAVLMLLLIGIYVLHYRVGIAKLKRMGRPHATLRLTDAEFLVSSGAGTFSVPWATFTDLWRFPNFWLLVFGRGQFMTLPLQDLNADIRIFIESRVPATKG